ncbi:MAG: DNA-deoxyinosine glycosylase, partial [Candidatus Gastranaerophilales bacterium]|nr:DNA-deoxyinosine glycosylase [Candidatus Gastranaerophilales bacterium]
MKKNGFNAIIDNNSKILILGSFPSVKSREISFYYGNKQNRFWKMLEFTFNKKIEDNVDSK